MKYYHHSLSKAMHRFQYYMQTLNYNHTEEAVCVT